jgi:cytochrome b561
MRITDVGAALSGSMTGLILNKGQMATEAWWAFAIIIGVGLLFGTMARIGMIEHQPETTPELLQRERKLSVMLFGCLYIIAFALANILQASLLTAPLVGAAVGSAGPIAIHWLIDRFFGNRNGR